MASTTSDNQQLTSSAAQPEPPVAQPLVVQPVVVPSVPAPDARKALGEGPELKLISHSTLFYWWPVWLVGYALALVTWLGGQDMEVQQGVIMRVHPNQSLGTVFGITLILVMFITNVSIRGLASALVIVSIMFLTVLFAYLDWWNDILNWLGRLYLYLDMRFYLVFATVIFLIWAVTTFVLDHLSYWRIRPGQMTQEFILGAAARSYDTTNMVVEKHRDDLFRHWILGFGSGDLEIHTSGATRDQIAIPNILFLGRKVSIIQEMAATDPTHFGSTAVK